ncbi:protein of unknown function [Xenorhabdus nematophila AN6/1]|nr:protein of unknown function [Xenorhabdus nematophila AN6/1]
MNGSSESIFYSLNPTILVPVGHIDEFQQPVFLMSVHSYPVTQINPPVSLFFCHSNNNIMPVIWRNVIK